MTPRQLARLIDLTIRPLTQGHYRRVDGPGFTAYQYAGHGPGSEVIRLDVAPAELSRVRGPVDELPEAAQRLPWAFRALTRDPELPAVEGTGWKLTRHAAGVRLELKVGPRHAQRFTL